MINEADIKKGQAIYTSFFLKLYNILVLDISNRCIWRCSKYTQLDLYNKYLSANHLDIGVGTGYYLQACKAPSLSKLSLMDLNPNCLRATSKALQHRDLNPTSYLADIFKPQPNLEKQFNSISMNYLLHCLPGSKEIKERCISNATNMLIPGGILFGSTILGDEQLHTKLSKSLCAFYNKKGIFSNEGDSLQALQTILNKHLTEVTVSVVGCVALFRGRRPAP